MSKKTRKIKVGPLFIGGGERITVQSMTNTRTENIEDTVSQIERLRAVGCDIVRLAVPNMEAANAFYEIKKRTDLPLVADVHFDYRLAIRAAERGADKIRINPGNIGGEDKLRAIVGACRERSIPIRVGVNGGSLEKSLLDKYGGLSPEAMVESAMGQIDKLEKLGFGDICVSLKASSVPLTVAAYRLLSEKVDYPLHIGITEAGTEYMGIIKSACGIGTLLLDGIGDTIRVSLTAEPEAEVRAGIAILKALGLRREGVSIVSCPTCGRTEIDLISLAGEVESRLKNYPWDITVAVMGCVVNGPGEASHADYGIAGGRDKGIIFRRGEIVKTVPAGRLADELLELIEKDN
ncbi:MAG TPA: flavodoxin-dependent (E)-4-hydroxy-3-methylbut-2-enyl-diphosphate synthase [Clostridiales bacterium]|jgi:(E)-4-hydroxy-3-methylbut-2-enyl-diphosphate synthase|nr:flavodoxin-dependent (E)-4-hydroxy-3-methylbut-2-enyl-diphosphate synthase [Clostridiales bacterium]